MPAAFDKSKNKKKGFLLRQRIQVDFKPMMLLGRNSLLFLLLASLVPTDVLARADDISTTGQTDKQSNSQQSCWVMWLSTISLFDVVLEAQRFCFFSCTRWRARLWVQSANVVLRCPADHEVVLWELVLTHWQTEDPNMWRRKLQVIYSWSSNTTSWRFYLTATYLKGKKNQIVCKWGQVLFYFQCHSWPSLLSSKSSEKMPFSI